MELLRVLLKCIVELSKFDKLYCDTSVSEMSFDQPLTASQSNAINLKILTSRCVSYLLNLYYEVTILHKSTNFHLKTFKLLSDNIVLNQTTFT